MDDKKLLLLSLFFSLAGVLVLFFLSKSLVPAEASLDSLSGEDVGREVLVKGTVRSFSEGKSYYSFSLCDSHCIKAVDFESKFKLSQGDWVEVEGRVSEYRGALEITVDSVEILGGQRA